MWKVGEKYHSKGLEKTFLKINQSINQSINQRPAMRTAAVFPPIKQAITAQADAQDRPN